MAAAAFVQEGDYFRLVVSGLSIVAAILLLVGGITLCFKRAAGGTIAVVAAKLSVPVSLFSAAIGLMGSHALMYGAGVPDRDRPPAEARHPIEGGSNGRRQ